jgi:Na+/H+ antiporter NhaC
MRKHERRAIEDGVLVDTSHGAVPGEADQDLPTRKDARVSDLVVPEATLIGVTVAGALWIGISNTEGAITPMQILANTDVIISLFYGGTFGTFGLILPMAAEIVVSVDLSLLIPVFGAVLAGAIFGDHTSSLSDTTILSSIGSGIQLIDHTTTQIPYALVCAVASLAGFIVLGFTRSTTVGLLTALATLAVAVFVLRSRFAGESSRESEVGGITG